MDIKIGLHNKTEQYSGLEIALISNEKNDSRGVNVAGGWNEAKDSSYGVNVALGINGAVDSSYGVNVAGVGNVVKDSSYGMNVAGLANYVEKEMYGAQLSLVNAAGKLRGLQAGLYNVCGEDSKGLQIGLINRREGVPWYAKITPVIAIRTGIKRKEETLTQKQEEKPTYVSASQ